MYFESNLKALQRHGEFSAPLIQALREEPLVDYPLYATEAGDYTIEAEGLCLHAVSGAQEEARQVVEAQCKPGLDKIHVILGMGLGYLLDAAHTASQGKIVVYEPNLSLLRFVFEHVDLSSYLQSGRVWVFGCRKKLMAWLRHHVDCHRDHVDFLLLPAYAHCFKQELPMVLEEFVEVIQDRLSDYGTMKQYHLLWVESFFQNLPCFDGVLAADVLKERFAGKPAVIASTGPSLDAAIVPLRQLRDCVVLITVNSGLRELWKHGIIPDFVVLYDAIELDRLLAGVPEEVIRQTNFIVGFLAQNVCYRLPAKSIIYLPTTNNIQFCQWLDSSLKEPQPSLPGGGSVSIVALQLALLMGCNPVVLTGQDLAYPGNRVYAGNVGCQVNEAGMITLKHQAGFDYFPDQRAVTAMGQNGEELLSTGSFLRFISQFEETALNHPQVEFYNASTGGAQINGYQNRPLESFLGQFESWRTEESVDFPRSHPRQAERRALLHQGVRKLNQHMENFLAVLERLEGSLSLDAPDLARRVILANKRILELLGEDPLLPYFLFYELGDYNRTYQALSESRTVARNNAQALLRFCADSQKRLRDSIFPHVEQALRAFESGAAQNPRPQGEPVGSLCG